MPKAKNYSRDEEVRRLWLAGKSLRESGAVLGISHAMVGYIRARLGLKEVLYRRKSRYPQPRTCVQCGMEFQVCSHEKARKLCDDKSCLVLYMTETTAQRMRPDPVLVETALALWDAETKPEDVAAAVGVSVATVWNWIRAHRPNRAPSHGWAKRQRERQQTNQRAAEALWLRHEQGRSLVEIAAHFGVSRATAKQYVSIGKGLAGVA